MKLSEYLKRRGSRALSNAEALAIGVSMRKGWVKRFADNEVPEHLASVVGASCVSNKSLKKIAKRHPRVQKKIAAKIRKSEYAAKSCTGRRKSPLEAG